MALVVSIFVSYQFLALPAIDILIEALFSPILSFSFFKNLPSFFFFFSCLSMFILFFIPCCLSHIFLYYYFFFFLVVSMSVLWRVGIVEGICGAPKGHGRRRAR